MNSRQLGFLAGYMSKESGYWSEAASPMTSMLASAGVGGALGGTVGGVLGGSGGAVGGSMVGAVAGAHLSNIANVVGALIALGTPTRDTAEQAEADADMAKNLLIPGKGTYNAYKRIGYAIRNPDLKKAKQERKEKEKAE